MPMTPGASTGRVLSNKKEEEGAVVVHPLPQHGSVQASLSSFRHFVDEIRASSIARPYNSLS